MGLTQANSELTIVSNHQPRRRPDREVQATAKNGRARPKPGRARPGQAKEARDYDLLAETSSGCVNFNLSNVPTVEKSNAFSGFKIGFKRSLDNCPRKTENAPFFGETTVMDSYTSKGILYNYNITELKIGNSIKWTFLFKLPTICPEDSFKFTRGEVDVCVSFRFFPDSKICQNQEMGVKLCEDSGDFGLTGPYSNEERVFFAEKLSTYPSAYRHVNFWIDGRRIDGSSSYAFSDSSINSTNGYGSIQNMGGNCYFLATKVGNKGSIFFHSCTIDTSGDYCLRGSICLTSPL
ncbi:hypothetical protein B9Z55_028571 [Caenorhabditis nigoni]|nr:hypothetical protein B9Z55_028571 [Caenorhabditis nigoni]